MRKKEWFIPDMYRPEINQGSYVSHEAICVLNTGSKDCTVKIFLYFEDKDPQECEAVFCPARRTKHIRTDVIHMADGTNLPVGIGYAAHIKCSVPVIVQYTRVDTTQEALALMTTMGC